MLTQKDGCIFKFLKAACCVALLATSLLFPTPVSAQDKPQLTWLSIDWQPAWIHEGPLKGQGYAQMVTKLIRSSLPEFEHLDRAVTNVRIYSVLQNREACFAASPYQGTDLQPDKREGIVWTAPTYLYFYQGLIAGPWAVDAIKRHQKEDFIDFESLISDPSIVGAFQPGRSYSRWLNPILADDEKTANLFKWSGEDQLTQSMFKLMEARRIDYFVDYVIMLKFHEESSGEPSDYVYLPITQHKNMFGLGGIACSDTPTGRKAIAAINGLLSSMRKETVIMGANRRWLMPEDQEKLYWATWRDEVLTKSQ